MDSVGSGDGGMGEDGMGEDKRGGSLSVAEDEDARPGCGVLVVGRAEQSSQYPA